MGAFWMMVSFCRNSSRRRCVLAATLSLYSVVGLIFSTPSVFSQDWAYGMFDKPKHDFGVVSRNAKAEHTFVFENKFKEDIHIASVRSSCGCTKPSIKEAWIRSGEKGEILAQFNTRSFIGQKSAIVTVVFDQPYYAEVQLIVTGQIRSDIVTEPGEVQFGEVPVGQGCESSLRISYAGRPDWKIVDVRGQSEHLEVRLQQEKGTGSTIAYRLQFRLKPSAPAGDFHEEIVIVTNDSQNDRFTLPVFATVRPPISVTPPVLAIGTIAPNAEHRDRIIVRGDRPFAITDIRSSDPRIRFQLPSGERPIHVVPFVFTANESLGEIREKIVVCTNLGEDISGECTIVARVGTNIARGTASSPTPR